MASLKYWLWLTSRKGMDPVSALTVLDHFGTPERAYYAQREDFDQLAIRPAVKQELSNKNLDAAEKILEDSERLGLRIMTFGDADYPTRLKQLSDPPAVLYIRGKNISFDEEVAIGVVGAREPSEYGVKCARKFGMELAQGGALVVSGIAEGLDSCAIRGALMGGGRVVSVLAGGVDMPFPKENRYLYEDVAAAGALISEYPPGTLNRGHHYLARNRILSGLSLGVLAIECRIHSGTMNTVNHALEQDRDIFAVPGALDTLMGEGTNHLIRQGAKLVTCGGDILEEYWGLYPLKLKNSAPMTPEAAQARMDQLDRQKAVSEQKPKTGPREEAASRNTEAPAREIVPAAEQKERFTDDELAVLFALSKGELTADELVEQTQLPARRVLSTLTMLQIGGAVEEHSGKRFAALIALEEI